MIEDYPENQIEFEQRFGTEDDCRQYLIRLRWPEGFTCPRCHGREAWLNQRHLWECRQCAYQASLTAGTLFQDTHKPLRLWFRTVWHVTSQKQGASALGVQRVMGLGSYTTAWSWLHKLRRAMVRPGRDRLAGTMEVDETYIGGLREGKRGRGSEGKALVVIAAQKEGRKIGRIRLARVPDASANSLVGFIQQVIEPGSLVCTDGWESYSGLPQMGYRHKVVVLQGKKKSAAGTLLPRVHLVASLLKRWILGTHQGAIGASHLDYYLDEFTFRFNRRTSRSRGKLFFRLLEQAVNIAPVEFKALVGGKDNPQVEKQQESTK